MSSRDRLSRMDIDTSWPYQHKVRKLQARFAQSWPAFWCAYLGLLAEAWSTGDRRLTLGEAWVGALPVDLPEAAEALRSVGLLDRFDRIPVASWREWYEPVAARLQQRSAAGQAGAAARWSQSDGNATAKATAMRSDAIAMHHPSPPARNARPSRGRARDAGEPSRGADAGPTKEEASRVWSELRPKLAGLAAKSSGE